MIDLTPEQYCPHCGHLLTYMATYDEDIMLHCETCLRDWRCTLVDVGHGCEPATIMKQQFWG